MKLKDLFRLVARNLWRTSFRAGMSAAGVVIGAAAIVLLISLSAGLQTIATQNLGGLGPLNEVSVRSLGSDESGVNFVIVGLDTSQARKLKAEDLQAIAERPGVEAVLTLSGFRGNSRVSVNQLEASPQLRGADPESFAAFGLKVESGALDLGRWQVVVGAKVGESFSDPSVRSGDNRAPAQALQDETLMLKLTRNEADGSQTTRLVRLTVAGVLAPRSFEYDYAIFLRLSDVDELNAWATGKQVNRALAGYGQAQVLVRDAQSQAQLEQALSEQGFFATSPNQLLSQINQTYVALQAFVGGIGVVVFVIAGTGIANTLITAIYERTAEIGLMKAVGASSRQVTAIFLAEAIAIGGGGGMLGLALGWVLSQVANIVLGQSVGGQLGGAAVDVVATPLWVFVVVPLFAAGVGALAGLYPARRAAALDPVTALRYE